MIQDKNEDVYSYKKEIPLNWIRQFRFVYKEKSQRGIITFRAQRQAKWVVLELPGDNVIRA